MLDSFSTDWTIAICREYTDRVIQDELVGFGRLRNLAVEKTTFDWILSVDADERVTVELRQEILEELQHGPPAYAYSIPRKSHFLGHWVRHCGWYPDYRQPHLFSKAKMHYREDLVHEGCELYGRIGCLTHDILQYPFRDLTQFLHKMDRYSTLMAEEMVKSGKRFAAHQLVSHPLFTSIKMFIIR